MRVQYLLFCYIISYKVFQNMIYIYRVFYYITFQYITQNNIY